MSDIRKPRLFLTSMCNGGNIENIREIVEPIKEHLDGIIWVLHDTDSSDEGAQYLESVKGAGKVIHRAYNQRNWFSMNETLFAGIIQEGDFVIWTDALERPMKPFVSAVKGEIAAFMDEHELQVLFYYGKPFLLRYAETMVYQGHPHWWLTGFPQDGAIEWSRMQPDEKKVRFNTRPIKRANEPLHFVSHYLSYFVAPPAGSNHCALGLEKNGNPQDLFPPREARRLAFRRLLVKRGIPLTVEGVKGIMAAGLDDEVKPFFRDEKILNDAYRFLYLGRTDFADDHDWSNIIPIP